VSDALIHFLDPANAHEGVVAFGGPLTNPNLLRAYCKGIFPWPVNERILPWCCPEWRGVLDFKDLHVPRRLARFQRQAPFHFTIDQAFADVIANCRAIKRNGERGTWITRDIVRAYCEFHYAGYAHSVEAWEGDELVGGLYGVAACGTFAGESMFSRRSNASKLALLFLIEHLQARGLDWIDIQMLTPHMEAMGAKEIPRWAFLERLVKTQQRQLVLFPG
jgi:leucyl/phenylalanyl-tRNA--protein transferase